MISRIEQVKRQADSVAVHVWGSGSDDCALACELGGAPVFRLDSGGFCAEWVPLVQEQVTSGTYALHHNVLSWQEVSWRELGRSLFKDLIVDREEEEYSRDPSWGTDEVEDGYLTGLEEARVEAIQRLRLAIQDDVLVMCAWRVYDRQRGILSAHYGLGDLNGDSEVSGVLDRMSLDAKQRSRLQALHSASLAWW